MNKNSIPALLLIAVIVVAYTGAKVYGQNKAKQIMDEQVEQLAPIAKVTYSDISFNPLTFKSSVKDITVVEHDSSLKAEIAEIVINRYDTRNDPPHYSDTEIRGMVIDFADYASLSPSMAQTGATLDMLGYSSITMDFRSKYSFDLDSKSLDESFIINVEDMGSLNLSMSLGEVDISEGGAMRLMFTYPLVIINKASLRYDDNSLVERLIAMNAKQQNISPKELTERTTAMLDELISTEKEAIAVMTMKAIRTYINNPGSITMSLAPETPAAIAELAPLALEKMLERMNFSIKL